MKVGDAVKSKTPEGMKNIDLDVEQAVFCLLSESDGVETEGDGECGPTVVHFEKVREMSKEGIYGVSFVAVWEEEDEQGRIKTFKRKYQLRVYNGE